MSTRSESTMQYSHSHIPIQDRRDSTLETNGSTPFQSHQSLGQALGIHSHSGAPVNPPPSYPRDSYPNRISPSPSPIHQNQNLNQNGAPPPMFSVQTSPPMKRKLVDGSLVSQVPKRRREEDSAGPGNNDGFDADGGGQGAKHWTDEEKSKLFNYLMGVGQDDHWNALRATKNSCLRECANDVFGNKKTYQALKGCYERNFNLFKQIYAFETYHAHSGSIPSITSLSETDRLREYERRLQSARKGMCDVGNITARTIDHWHRVGWYELFYRRWHGDPATTKPTVTRNSGSSAANGAGDDQDGDDDQPADYSADPNPINGGGGVSHDSRHPSHSAHHSHHHSYAPPLHPSQSQSQPHNASQSGQPLSPDALGLGLGLNYVSGSRGSISINNSNVPHPTSGSPSLTMPSMPSPSDPALSNFTSSLSNLTSSLPGANGATSTSPNGTAASTSANGGSSAMVNLTLTHGMVQTYLSFLQVQTQNVKMKLEYMRRREEREEKEGLMRREMEKKRMEREREEAEHERIRESVKAKADRAIELLGNPIVEASVKQAAGDYLKKLFTES